MKATRDEVFTALLKVDGNRVKAAELLGVSHSSLQRYIRELNLFGDIDRMGWTQGGGPARKGPTTPNRIVLKTAELRILEFIVNHGFEAGHVDYGAVAKEIYTQDNPTTRQHVYTAMDSLRRAGKLAYVDNKWSLV